MSANSSLLARAATAISDKSSLPIRAAAAATVAVGTLFGAHTASGQQIASHGPVITSEQCRALAAVAVEVASREVPMSAEFRQSFRNFLGANLTCDGPREIVWRTNEDHAIYRTIFTAMVARNDGFNLERVGVRLAPRPVASLQQPSQN